MSVFLHSVAAPPVPTGFRNTITSQSSSLYFGFTWDTSFNVVNYVSTYRLMANDFSVACPEICSSSSDPCQCSGLKAGINVSINVSAISCGSLEGPAIVVDIAPQGMSAALLITPLQFNILFLKLTLALDRVGRSACK